MLRVQAWAAHWASKGEGMLFCSGRRGTSWAGGAAGGRLLTGSLAKPPGFR